MHWSKRAVFLITLVAFLSNLAFGMSLPVGPKLNQKATAQQLNQAQYKHPSNEYLSFVTCEFLEEIEEAEQDTEQETDHDFCIDSKNQSGIFQGHHSFVYSRIHDGCKHPKYAANIFRNWLYKNNIFIHFQVFRI
jgi:hypothetical protein